MPWTAGVYTRGYPSWSADAASNLPISATKFDTEDNDFATGLNNCLTKDGLNVPSAAMSWTLANGKVLALGRSGNDGAILSLARVGGSNNPTLSFSAADTANTVTALMGANAGIVFNASGGIGIGAPTGGDPGLGGLNVATSLQLGGNPIWSGIPINSQAGNYTAVLLDNGRCLRQTTASSTYTIPANATLAFPVGAAISFFGDGTALSVAIGGTDTLQLANSSTTGTRTVAANAIGTALKVTATKWIISGTGVS